MVVYSSSTFSLYIVMQTASAGFAFRSRQRVRILEIILVFLICRCLLFDLKPAGLSFSLRVVWVRTSVSYDMFLAGFHSGSYFNDCVNV